MNYLYVLNAIVSV